MKRLLVRNRPNGNLITDNFQLLPNPNMIYSFSAALALIGINPFVFVPDDILLKIFRDARKDKGHIPVRGTINGEKYIQTLVKYSDAWRLYINATMLRDSPKRMER
ncbi:MAG TPA: DUF1905 domain-containing protein [Edaphocola sp.]|nr:DUF1905 domain-containing protein [Edaphocola sp.]